LGAEPVSRGVLSDTPYRSPERAAPWPTFADWLNAKTNGPDAPAVGSPDLAATMKALRQLATPRGLTVLDPGKAVDQNAFAVARSNAREYHLKTLSDLGASGLKVRLAVGDECVQRPYCEPGLKKTYGIDITAVDPKGVGTTQARSAVQSGQDQMVLTTATDATLDELGPVLLADDKHLQNATTSSRSSTAPVRGPRRDRGAGETQRRPHHGRPGIDESTGRQPTAVGAGRGADVSEGQGPVDARLGGLSVAGCTLRAWVSI